MTTGDLTKLGSARTDTRSDAALASSADFTLADFPEKAARWWPSRPAFIENNSATTYAQFADRIGRLASVLRDAEVVESSRVGLLASNSKVYFELFFACARLGAVLVPINTRLSPREVAYQVENADMTHAVLERTLEGLAGSSGLTELTHWWIDETYDTALASATPSVGRTVFPSETPVSQMYTSGTTGFAKGCVQSQGGWRASAMNLSIGMRIDRDAVVLVQSPLFHAWEFGRVLSHLLNGGSMVLPLSQSVEDYWDAIDTHKVTSVTLPRGVSSDLSQREHVTVVISQAGGFRSQFKQMTDHFFPNAEVYGIYGMTELTNIAIMSRSGEELEIQGNMGLPLPGVDAAVMDLSGDIIDGEGLGELLIRGPQVCLGYYKNPSATADLFRDGWLHTGDIVRVDEGGRFHFVDRAKDMIKTGGENVYSAEVERILVEYPGVADVAVFGVPDERWGEAVKAVISFQPGAVVDLDAIDSFCLENLAAYKRPRWYEVVPEIERSGTGKIVKNRLRERHDPTTAVRLHERT